MSTTKAKAKPNNLLEAINYFSDVDVANEYVANLRWPQGPVCPRCGCVDHSYISTRRVWKCKGCKKQYTVKLGTIFEGSPLGFDKWLPAIWLAANTKNGISSHELARSLGVTQKSAWFMLHRIREAMKSGSIERLDGEVEVDETYIGGKAHNMHESVRVRKITSRGPKDKSIVVGARQRDGETRAAVIPDAKRETLHGHIAENVEPGSTVYTDTLKTYRGLPDDYAHETINHAETYVMGNVHTNGIENFWSLLKRGLKGTYVSVDPAHLSRYVEERLFAYNLRDRSDYERFEAAIAGTAGRRLTYSGLTTRA